MSLSDFNIYFQLCIYLNFKMNDFNEDSGIFMTENLNINRKFDDLQIN